MCTFCCFGFFFLCSWLLSWSHFISVSTWQTMSFLLFCYFMALWAPEGAETLWPTMKLKQWPQTSMLCYFFVNLWQWGWCQGVTVTCPEALSQRGRQCHCQCSFSCQRCWLGFWQNALIWNQAVVADKFFLDFLMIQKPLQWKYFKWPLRRPDHTLMIMKMTF